VGKGQTGAVREVFWLFRGATADALIAEAEAVEAGEDEVFKFALVDGARAFALCMTSEDGHVGLGTIIGGWRHGGRERGVHCDV
jgi:hypothetical protein